MAFLPLAVIGPLAYLLGLFVLWHIVRGFGGAAVRAHRVSVFSLADGFDGQVALSGRARPTASGERLRAPVTGDGALVGG
ncbi:hypothetical protein [Salinigranum marinum]|uniref:hypothetical protein n=1 Tax=Salinigranum marinum TaxID=1515595 RepID=UPI00298A0411|nr:hypothetical protein [Salinigranum marinum]